MRRRLVCVLAGAVVASVACNALTGADDLGVGLGGGASGDMRGDGGRDGGSVGEGGATEGGGTPVVTPSLAACGDNMLCLPNSGGWTPALYVLFGLSSECPASWPDRKDYRQSGGGSCDCACTPQADSCGGSLAVRTGAACVGDSKPLEVATDGGCTALLDPVISLPLAVAATGAPPASCRGAVTPRLGGPQDVLTCAGATATPSAACDPGEVCVPKGETSQIGIPTSVACMTHEGDVTCPKNLPLRMVVGAAVIDGRSCGDSCECAPTTCNGGKLDLFNKAGCTQLFRSVNVDGTCTQGASLTAAAVRYTPGSPCAVSKPAQVLGTETVQVPRTFCCSTPLAP